ncbi:phage portal protein [Pararoseomonas sp. SCSIO 73927]|uniref:phage portal protein n=1 Tax=Pararoseomonas sp. SCSIO 73927 TaxID=3114537 RepID=UPI0030CCC46C
MDPVAPAKPRIRVPAGSSRMDTPLGAPVALPMAAPAQPHTGASTGRRLMHWRPGASGPNAVVQASGPELVRRSRDARRNNPLAKRAMDLIPTHVVGTGIKPRSLCSNRKVREALNQLWADQVPFMDADGTLDFYGQQALAVSEMVEGGEAFARLRTRRITDGLPVPLQIQLLPGEMVPLDYKALAGANPVAQGIERNAIGQRTAYWMLPRHPNEWIGTDFGLDMTPRRVPAGDVCHLFNVSRAGQLRGLPWLAAGIATLHQVFAYQDAELLRKQMAASIVAFVKKAVTGDTTPEEMAAAYGQVQQGLGDLPTVSMEPGTVQYLEPGEDITFSTPADVGTNYEPFLASGYRAVAASVNVLYEELTGNWKDANDRTFRAQFGTFKRAVRQWQWHLVCAQFNEPIWRRFVSYAVGYGLVRVPKSVTEADLYRVEHRPERWEYLNPKQDVETVSSEIEAGLTSREAAVAERGDDIEVIDAQRASDLEREERLRLSRPAKPGSQLPEQADPSGAE